MNRIEKLIAELLINLVFSPHSPLTKEVEICRFDELPKFPFSKGVSVWRTDGVSWIMNRIQKLIAELCPNGVEWKKLGEVAEIGTGSSNRNEATEDGKYPFFVRSKFVKKITLLNLMKKL